MKFQSMRASLTLLAGAALAFTATVQAADEPEGLAEVIVTAQKREQRLLDVPIAISAVTSANMQDAGSAQLADFLQAAPGVGIVDDNSGLQFIHIRGINSTFGNAPIGFYLDEMPFSYPGNTQVPDVRTYDLERVEILRGPQGTLYGGDSIGGTIRILTKDPVLDSFQASVDLTGMDTSDGDNSFSYKGMLNIPIKTDVAAFRLVASKEDFGGWVDNTGSNVKDQNERNIDNYRLKFGWQPNERMNLVLSAWHTKEDAVGNSDSLPNRTRPDAVGSAATEYDIYSATLRYKFDAFDLVSATSKMKYRNDNFQVFFAAPFNTFEDLDFLSEELRLTSKGDGRFSWTGGIFYRKTDRKTFLTLQAFAFTQDQTQESKSMAIFGEGTWALRDDLDLTIGLRQYKEDRFFTEVIDPATLAAVRASNPGFQPIVDTSFNNTSPRVNLAFKPNGNWLVYGNVSKGFRGGQAQPVISIVTATLFGRSIPTSIDPENLWAYELGTKGTFMDGRAAFEGAVFMNKWKDTQVLVRFPPTPVAALINGGKAETKGVELGFTFQPVKNWNVGLNYSHVNARYTETVPGTPIVAGSRITGVPESSLSANTTYRWPLSDNWQGFVHSSVQYSSDRTDIVSGGLPSDSTTAVDLRLGVEGSQWSAYLFADNLTDEDGAIDVRGLGPNGPVTRMRPRTYGLNIRYDFR